MLQPIISDNLEQIKNICRKYSLKELYLFGSAAKENFSSKSDIDFLFSMNDVAEENAFDVFFDFHSELEKLLGRQVDLVELEAVTNRYFINELNDTKIMLYNG